MLKPNYTLIGDAYAIIGGIPAEKVNLRRITVRKSDATLECGTLACAFGWLGLHPKFAPLLEMSAVGTWHRWRVKRQNYGFYADAAAALFGITRDEAINLFGRRGDSTYDSAILNGRGRISDKKLWLGRVRKFLDEKGVKSC